MAASLRLTKALVYKTPAGADVFTFLQILIGKKLLEQCIAYIGLNEL